MLMNNNEYLDLVQTIKQEIQQAQYKATLSVNKELIMLYYNIGKIINEHKSWGNKFIENLAADIKLSFPNAKGYSVRNLKYMSRFASTYYQIERVAHRVGKPDFCVYHKHGRYNRSQTDTDRKNGRLN